MNIYSTALKYNMEVNPDRSHVNKILDKLDKNDSYCPCLPTKNKDTVCPCKYMRTLNVCRCGLYIPSN